MCGSAVVWGVFRVAMVRGLAGFVDDRDHDIGRGVATIACSACLAAEGLGRDVANHLNDFGVGLLEPAIDIRFHAGEFVLDGLEELDLVGHVGGSFSGSRGGRARVVEFDVQVADYRRKSIGLQVCDAARTIMAAMEPESGAPMWKRIGPAGLLGLAWVAAPPLAGMYLLYALGDISTWLLAHPSMGLLLYVLIFILAAGFGLLPTYAQAILGGWVFGMWVGFPAALVGFAGASVIGYLIARTVSQDRVKREFKRHPRAEIVRDSLIGHGPLKTFFVVALLRVPPNSPFALTNLVMASSGVALLPFFFGTVVGMAPRTAAAVFLAAAGRASGAEDLQTLVKEQGWLPMVIGLGVTMVVLGVVGWMANRALERFTALPVMGQPEKPNESPGAIPPASTPREPDESASA